MYKESKKTTKIVKKSVPKKPLTVIIKQKTEAKCQPDDTVCENKIKTSTKEKEQNFRSSALNTCNCKPNDCDCKFSCLVNACSIRAKLKCKTDANCTKSHVESCENLHLLL